MCAKRDVIIVFANLNLAESTRLPLIECIFFFIEIDYSVECLVRGLA